ncbi:hypothetical protein J7438_18775 [Thalassotalea sp. G20_0]|nr:hypothetical protein [Thalassotalea sp. G20_0]
MKLLNLHGKAYHGSAGTIDGVVKNGKAPSGIQRFQCRYCRQSFQLEF